MRYQLLLALLTVLLFQNAQAQAPVCPSDYWRDKHLQNPDFQNVNSIFEQQVLNVFLDKKGHQGIPEQIRIVPVVVHIIHDNGPENLSDAQVQQAIQWLNQALANQGPFDQGSGVNTEIQLCLAQRTPEGQSTNGITRDQNALTEMQMETQDQALKNLNRWKPKDYLNIWLVRSICSVTYGCNVYGYANYPFAHGSNIDGIVIEAAYVSNLNKISGLAHETGHYFGLYHTFEGGCSNNNCLVDGDRICDTPPDQSIVGIPCGDVVNTCNSDIQSGPFATDQPDMTWNYLDYGHLECFHDYTPDQATRMNAALDGIRHSLLESKGCLPPCPAGPVASFTASATTVNIGETVNFHSTSQNAASYQWTVDGIPFSSQVNAANAFNTLGWHTVTLTVFPGNSALCDPDQATINIQVLCPVQADFSLSNLSPEQNDTVRILDQSQQATQSSWSLNGISLGSSPDSIVFTAAGTFQVQLIAGNGLCADTASATVVVSGFCVQKTFEYRINTPYNSAASNGTTRVVGLSDGNIILHYYGIESAQDIPILCKFTPFGKLVWCKRIVEEDSLDLVLGIPFIKATPDGGFAVFRHIIGSLGYDGGLHVEKFSGDGTLLWAKKIRPNVAFTLLLNDVAVLPDGFLLTGGDQLIKLNTSGDPVWLKSGFSAGLIRPYPDGGCVALDYETVIRIGPAGEVLWKRYLPYPVYGANLKDLIATPDGKIFLAGNISVDPINPKGLLIKLDETGETEWVKYYREIPVSRYEFFTMTTAYDGKLVLAGACQADNPSPGGLKKYSLLLKTDLDGNVIWSRHLVNSFAPSDIISMPTGELVITGLDGISPMGGFPGRILKTDPEGRQQACEEVPHTVNVFDYSLDNQPYTLPLISNTALTQPAYPVLAEIARQLDTLCAPVCQVSFEICNNNLDDDGDGLFDCLDPECNCERDICTPRYSEKWFFGKQVGLDFQSGKPKLIAGGQTQLTEAYSSICDAKGNLLFYTDGQKVYNRFHEVMPNGDLSGAPALKRVIIIPYPKVPSKYYLFGINTLGELTYSRISMTLEGGKGDIEASLKNLNIDVDCEGLAAVTACGFEGFWMLTWNEGNKMLSYRIDQNGLITNPFTFPTGLSMSSVRQLKISPDGRRVACTGLNSITGLWAVAVFDFNPYSSGTVFNAQWLDEVPGGSEILGVEFSPSGRFLYLTGKFPGNYKLRQYDLDAGDLTAIRNSMVDLAFFPGRIVGYPQLGPDGKIYAATRQNIFNEGFFLGIIHQPDQAGDACQFQNEALDLSDLYPPGGIVVDWLPVVISDMTNKAPVKFPYYSPDTICDFNAYQYQLKNFPCTVSSITWQLEQIDAMLIPFGQTAYITFVQPGTGRLIAKVSGECGTSSDTLAIVVADPTPKILNLGPDITVCQNGVVTLHADGGFARYLWSDNTSDSFITTTQPGEYWVKAWDLCGNLYTDTLLISVAPNSVLDLGPDLPPQCPGFVKAFQRPAGFTSWQWAPADFLNCTDCPVVSISPDQNATWTILGATADGCISIDTLRAFIQDTLPITLDTFICANLNLNLFGTTLPPDTSAQFFFPGTGATCDTLWTVGVMPLENPEKQVDVSICPGTYFNFNGIQVPPDTTLLIPLSQPGQCDSLVTIKTHSYPILTLQLPQDTTIKIGASVLLETEVTGTNPFDIQWTPAEHLSCSDCLAPLASPLDTQTYTLNVTDANGCSNSGSVTLRVQEICEVKIPNAFSPNGDGANDIFRPICDPCVKTVLQWRIFNRWGQNVFSQYNYSPEDAALGWDGKDQNGKAQASDVYIWILEVAYIDGRRETRQKEVTLIR